MTIEKRRSLRKCINAHCKCCIYDPKAAGTWRQQVTLCSVAGCDLFPVKPTSKAPIPEAVLDYYQVTGPERALCTLSRPQQERFTGVAEGSPSSPIKAA